MHPFNPLLRKVVAVAAAAALLATSSGCSLVAGGSQRFRVESDPPGARVFVNGQDMGSTPIDTRIQRRENAFVTVKKRGYHTASRTTGRELSTIGVIDVIGGCFWLVPFLGLISDGAYVQTPKRIFVHLSPSDGKEEE